MLAELRPYIDCIVCSEVEPPYSDSREWDCIVIASDVNVVLVGMLRVIKSVRESKWRYAWIDEEGNVEEENKVLLEYIEELLSKDYVAAVFDVYEEWRDGRKVLVVKYLEYSISFSGNVAVIIDPVARAYPSSGLLGVLIRHGNLNFRILRSM